MLEYPDNLFYRHISLAGLYPNKPPGKEGIKPYYGLTSKSDTIRFTATRVHSAVESQSAEQKQENSSTKTLKFTTTTSSKMAVSMVAVE